MLRKLRLGTLSWLLLLYAGLTYLAVGTISVSQINSRFGDEAGYIFHVADLADRERAVRTQQLHRAEIDADLAQQKQEAALVEINAQAQRLGVPMADVRTALDDPKASVRLKDFNVAADADSNRIWDNAVSEFYRQKLFHDLAEEHRATLLTELRSGLARLAGDRPVGGKVLGDIDESTFQTAASTAAGLRAFGYAWLFSIPAEVLTLVLALVLGALGSALHMTKVLLEDTEPPPNAWYLFRPCQGVLMALVVFVLLKAGQLTVGAGDTDTLNPYFVAFVGTVSGLLSPDAYRMIQRAGATLIPKGDDLSDRWAFGLAQAMAAAGVDAATLAAGIGVTEAEMKQWVAEKTPVPAREQGLIAAWLHADTRQLFTADAPRQSPEAAAAIAAAAAVPLPAS